LPHTEMKVLAMATPAAGIAFFLTDLTKSRCSPWRLPLGEGRTGLFQVRLNVSPTAFCNGEIQPHKAGYEYLQ
ncbi:MAG: hypothetical protein V7L14_12300, partial [Nostoc sp.]|uniref:hypothetical protein n=1 Tax=Nostoc sp. TaxID=1180 RepID=UPI002FF48AB8